MSTISSKIIIIEMLQNRGVYCGDPAPVSIYKYTHSINHQELYGVFYDGAYCDIFESPFVKDPVLFFFEGEVTEAGNEWLQDATRAKQNKHSSQH